MSTQTDLGADNERLRALVQVLVDAGDRMAYEVEDRSRIERMMSKEMDISKHERENHGIRAERQRRRVAAWNTAKEQGFTPTNTEDNG